MNILKIGNKKKKKTDVTTKMKLGGSLSRQNTNKAAQITAMKDAGMATERDLKWLKNYNASK
jgi:hypothetical protein